VLTQHQTVGELFPTSQENSAGIYPNIQQLAKRAVFSPVKGIHIFAPFHLNCIFNWKFIAKKTILNQCGTKESG
jgi:hypothetical protein